MISNYYFSQPASTISRRRRRSIRCCTPGRSGSRSSTTCWRRRSWAGSSPGPPAATGMRRARCSLAAQSPSPFSYVTLAILSGHDRRLAFFSIMTRSWQFAAGGMLAIAVLRGTPVPARLRSALGVAGLLGGRRVGAALSRAHALSGGAAGLLPTIGTLLLLACGLGNERAPLVRCLASRPAVAIGVLSYSWYLWHWPLIELMRTLPIGQESIWKDVASSSVALLLSVPTYLLLERPMKTLRRPEHHAAVTAAVSSPRAWAARRSSPCWRCCWRGAPSTSASCRRSHPGAPYQSVDRLPRRPEPAEVQLTSNLALSAHPAIRA